MKYKLLKKDSIQFLGRTLFRIQAEISFGLIVKGELGGYIEKEDNLSRVYGNAWVSGDARVKITQDYKTISSLGDTGRTITITKSNKLLSAGCFLGTVKEFETKVNLKYKKGSDYHLAIKYIKAWLKLK